MSMANLFPLPSTEHTAPGDCTSSLLTPACALGSEGEFGNCTRPEFAASCRAPGVKPWHSQGLQGGGKAARRRVSTEPNLFKNSSDLVPPFPWSNQLWASLLLLPALDEAPGHGASSKGGDRR